MTTQPGSAPPPATVIVYTLDIGALQDHREELESVLAAAEREQAGRYARPELRDRFALVRGALRHVLGGWLGRDAAGLALETTPYGQPILPGNALGFSVSHARDRALIAVAQGHRVGVDIAWLGEPVDTAAVARWLPGVPVGASRHDCWQAWAVEEARRKAAGVGFAAPLPAEAAGWHVRMLAAPDGFVAALAVADAAEPDVLCRSYRHGGPYV